MPDIITAKDFLDTEGKVCDKATWLAAMKAPSAVLGYCELVRDKDTAQIFARYAGIDHGAGCAFEIGIDGSELNRFHKVFKTAAECLAEYDKQKLELEKAGWGVAAKEADLGD